MLKGKLSKQRKIKELLLKKQKCLFMINEMENMMLCGDRREELLALYNIYNQEFLFIDHYLNFNFEEVNSEYLKKYFIDIMLSISKYPCKEDGFIDAIINIYYQIISDLNDVSFNNFIEEVLLDLESSNFNNEYLTYIILYIKNNKYIKHKI